jgi:hypothetical protein
MTMRPASQPHHDPFFEAWWKVVVAFSLVILVGGQFWAVEPTLGDRIGLFFVSIPFFAIPVAFLSAVFVWAWETVKLVFE